MCFFTVVFPCRVDEAVIVMMPSCVSGLSSTFRGSSRDFIAVSRLLTLIMTYLHSCLWYLTFMLIFAIMKFSSQIYWMNT